MYRIIIKLLYNSLNLIHFNKIFVSKTQSEILLRKKTVNFYFSEIIDYFLKLCCNS